MNELLRISGSDLQWIFECTFDRWQAKIGDPHVLGWVTVFAYTATCALALATRLKLPRHPSGQRFFWSFLVFILAILAVNKQLDLQSLATAVARCSAKAHGWYDNRRAFQITVILCLIAVMVFAALLLFWMIRRTFWRNALALTGLTAVLAFVLVRAVGFHNVDALINHRISGIRMNWILELSGIVLIALNTVFHLARHRPKPPT